MITPRGLSYRTSRLLTGALAVVLLLAIVGCSAVSPSTVADQTAGVEAPADTRSQPEAVPQEGSPLEPARKIARTASMVVVVDDLATAASQLRQTAASVGGQVVSENLVTVEVGDEGVEDGRIMPTTRSTIVLSVPADQLDKALEEAARVGEVNSRTISAEDVTTQVVDVEARIKTMRESIARVRALMERAGTLTEIAALEAELTRRQSDLESLLAQQQVLSTMVEQSTITVSLMTRRQAEGIASGGFLGGLQAGWEAFVASGRFLVTLLGAALPFLLAGAVVAAPILWWRRRRARRAAGLTSQTPEPTPEARTSENAETGA